jgi:virulence factor Mce-like protein
VVALSATVLASCGGGAAPYTVTAVFPSAEGLFPGNAVQVLGVGAGTVTAVAPTGDHVVVTMSVQGSQALPADVRAALTTPQLLGEPSIELAPGYTGGPKLAPGAVIPEDRTSVPISTDQLLRDLQQYLGQVDAPSLGALVSNLSEDLQGQGQGLNQLIDQGAGTLSLLAQKGNDLGRLNGSLAAITGTLKQRTATVTALLQSYSQVAHVLATESGPLGDSITQLADASQQLAGLLDPNLQPLQQDIGTITQVGRTLDRNLSSVDQGLSSAVALFSAAGRAYDPTHQWLNLNNQLAPGVTANVVAGLVRDRLAGVCRRVLANHGSGLSAGAVQTLQSCGNPSSGFFDPLLALVPSILSSASGQTQSSSSASAQQLLAEGLNRIPGLSSSQRSALSALPSAPPAAPTTTAPTGAGTTLGGGTQLPSKAPVTDQQANGGGGLVGGLLHGLTGVVHFFGSLW